MKEVVMRSQSIGNSLKNSIEKILVLGIAVHDINGLTEKCREVIQTDTEIAFCVITDTVGHPMVSSDPHYSTLPFISLQDQANTADTLHLKAHTIGSGSGTFITTTTPLLSFDSKPVGYIFIGFPQQTIDDRVRAIVIRSCIVFVGSFFMAFALVVFFTKRTIITPIAYLLDGVNRIARGDYEYEVKQLPVEELDELGNKISYMAGTLKSRDDELRNNYRELSETHKKLNFSYDQLKSLSSDLEKSEKLYKQLLEVSGDAIVILDSSEQVVIANRQAEELIGCTVSELVAQHVSSLFIKLQVAEISHLLKIITNAYGVSRTSVDVSLIGSSGQMFCRMYANSVKMADTVLLQLIFHDMTAERETLLNLEKSAAGLVRLNKMKDSFLGLASHELKTPLTVIIGYSELLLSEMKEHLSDTAREMISNISSASLRLDNIVKDMIDVSMIDQKQLGLKRLPLDVNELVEISVRELRFFFALRKQEITLSLASDLPAYHGDQTRLLQMLSNVIGNAIKFTPDYGRITVTTTMKSVLRENRTEHFGGAHALGIGADYEDALEIVVEDNGIGINAEDHLKIFDKFYEAGNIEEHSSGKVAFKSRGVGLGLSIAKGVAEMHGGHIWVESPGYDPVSNPGSRFYILLPLDAHSVNDKVVEPQPDQAGNEGCL